LYIHFVLQPVATIEAYMTSKKHVYLLSGLGADKRVFDYLDLKAYHTTCIEWLPPGEDESLSSYTQRLLPQITTENPVLIGVSFGGILAVEISKLIKVEKIIQISSLSCCDDMPTPNKLVAFFKLNKLIPATFFTMVNEGLFWFFGAETKKEKAVLKSIIEDSDPDFVKWGMDKVLNWEHVGKVANMITIHGTADRIFPIENPDYPIEGGGHLMIMNKSKEISDIIKKEIGE
jgi:hypothetical protein